MLFIILLYYLALYICASPIPMITSPSLESNLCADVTHSRTIWNIIWSYLATFFSCTWVAIHLNMPCPKQREAKNHFQKWIWNPLLSFMEHCLPLFICALLVPEYILAWVIWQYLTAQKIACENEGELGTSSSFFSQCNSLLDRRWSRMHRFFIIMGGFHLFKHSSEEKSGTQSIPQEDDYPLHPLLASDLMHDDIYSFAMPTEAEIKDRGKSNLLAKSLVLLQTSWFIM